MKSTKSTDAENTMKSYREHYESSMNKLIDSFESNLDISPILSNKSASRIAETAEEKEIEDFSLIQPTKVVEQNQTESPKINHEFIDNESDCSETKQFIDTESIPYTPMPQFIYPTHQKQMYQFSQSCDLPMHTINSNISHFIPEKLVFPSNNHEMGEENDNLFMPITPTLPDSALRALLSQLRIKCKTLHFQSAQQRKYILNVQKDINGVKNEISAQKLKIYDYEQSILMFENNRNNNLNLEYLRGAELHQTRQELSFVMHKMNELKSENLNLQKQTKLSELDHETYNRAVKEEYERLLREINQYKILFDQRGREIKELKAFNTNQSEAQTKQFKELETVKKEKQSKLVTVTEQLSELRNNFENMKSKYGITYERCEKMKKLNKTFELEMEEKDQNIISLKRVNNNLKQEIDALCRSNRNFREIRNKSTSQLLESQKYEIDSIKQQISDRYETYLENEKSKNDKLQQLLRERTAQLSMSDCKCIANKGIQTEESDPYNCSMNESLMSVSETCMDEFGMLMFQTAKQEIEQLRQTNEKLMKLHAKNHFRKPRVEDQCTQTHSQTNTSANSSFCSVQTQKFLYSPTKSDTVLINDVSMVSDTSTADNSFTKS